MPKITFLSKKCTFLASQGSELLDIYKANPWVPLKFGCTKGHCGTCRIKIMKGLENLTPPTKEELGEKKNTQFDHNYRLACQCALLGDIEIE